MFYNSLLVTTLLLFTFLSRGQNLPSLLTERNINSTFSILAYDQDAQEWGIAVATDNIYVGNSTIYIKPGLGAFSVIAETEPRYAHEGFKKLQAGKSIEEAITEVRLEDPAANYRQVSGIDAKGNTYAFTGRSLKYWKGHASEQVAQGYVVMGNQLSEAVLSEMAKAFEHSKGTLAQRLLTSLQAGQKAGGQISGKQSAAVVVKGLNNEWYNQIDLRVDHSKNPIQELSVLMDYHYGRIVLNQSLYAIRKGDKPKAKEKLHKAETMLNGWTGMYSKIARAHLGLQNEAAAIKWIKKGLAENANWEVNLSAFYVLHQYPKMHSLIKPEAFTVKDWEAAINMMSNLGRELAVIELAHSIKEKGIESSYLNYLLGRAYYFEKDRKKAIQYLNDSLNMDAENIEAKRLLTNIEENGQ